MNIEWLGFQLTFYDENKTTKNNNNALMVKTLGLNTKKYNN